ncbi:MAG TPA: hypothetical protein VFI28_03200 [Candidatus Limnocylindrales bacterium]|nr:hypothetical protein [Candidatus Limnocylindrales bacterium]
MTRHRRTAAVGLVALVAAMGALLSPAAATTVAAAAPDLTIVTDAHYEVRPADRLVRVTIDATAVNHRSDTKTRRYYFDGASLAVLPGAKGFRVTASGASPGVSVTKSTKDYTLVRIGFGKRVYSHATFHFRLSFDLPDPGGSATRDVRVGSALVTFPVWAFATPSTAGSTVSVTFPTGYDIQFEQGSLPGPEASGGKLVYRSGSIDKPLSFFAFVNAQRAAAYTEQSATATIGGRSVDLAIRPWSDDPAWGRTVADLFTRGLPVLDELVGVRYPRTDRLVVQEAASRTTGGYAGLFDPSTGRIEVAYYASPFVILHEAAHAWFNGALLVDRWADEGFASYYAELAAAKLGIKATPPKLTADLAAAKIPLNAWGGVSREDSGSKTEDYAYAATLQLAREIAKRAGEDGLAKVWAAAAAHEAADQPGNAGPTAAPSPATPSNPETTDEPTDWRSLLDLLETRTGQSYADLWRTWVVRPDEAPLLDERAAAREDYAATVRAAADWELPPSVRRALDAWQFSQARALLAQARDVLDRRSTLVHDAAAANLRLPDAVERAFEGDAGFRAASTEADAESAAIRTLVAAERTRPANPDLVTQLGLYGSSPDASIADARSDFEADRLSDAVANAESARGAWLTAADVGRERLLRIGLAALLALLLLGVAVRWWLGHRRRATLAAPPDPPVPG